MKKLKIFLIAGEASGDYIGAKLIDALRASYADQLILEGIGCDLMKEAGITSKIRVDKIAVVGIIELIPMIFEGLRLLKAAAKEIKEFEPDILITIDAPTFSFRLAKMVHELKALYGTKFVHYVSPTIWAYKASRLQYMEKYYDLVLAIFPFEPLYYKQSSLECEYIGHPIVEYGFENGDGAAFRKQHGILKSADVLGIFAGSRIGEIKKMLPIFIEAINQFVAKNGSRPTVVFPVISEKIKNIIESFKDKMDFEYVIAQPKNIREKIDMFCAFNHALVKSGTSSHELVFANVPMIVAYKISALSHFIAKHFYKIQKKIKFITIANILRNKEIIPEYVQDKCTPEYLCEGLLKLYDDMFCKQQLQEYKQVRSALKSNNAKTPSQNAAELIISLAH